MSLIVNEHKTKNISSTKENNLMLALRICLFSKLLYYFLDKHYPYIQSCRD